MGGGEKVKKSGGSATSDQVKDRQKKLKPKFFQTESALKSCPPIIALTI
jgi:hypothetical protein